MDASVIQNITIFAIPMILAITLHEASHAFAARYFGDSTAYMLGRMTLNPVKHIDPIWTIAVPLLMILFTLGIAIWYELNRRRKARVEAAREAEGRRAADAELA